MPNTPLLNYLGYSVTFVAALLVAFPGYINLIRENKVTLIRDSEITEKLIKAVAEKNNTIVVEALFLALTQGVYASREEVEKLLLLKFPTLAIKKYKFGKNFIKLQDGVFRLNIKN